MPPMVRQRSHSLPAGRPGVDETCLSSDPVFLGGLSRPESVEMDPWQCLGCACVPRRGTPLAVSREQDLEIWFDWTPWNGRNGSWILDQSYHAWSCSQ